MKIFLLAFSLFFLSHLSYGSEKIVLAGGCFWCIEAPFDKTPGVISAVSGYIHGKKKNPTYTEVSRGQTGHIEAVEVTFDPKKISLLEILAIYWQSFDPTDAGGSFHDRGKQYTSGIFYFTEAQKSLAEKTKKYLDDQKIFPKKIVTPIFKAKTFYQAEKYHQDYHKKNPTRYKSYRVASGRDRYLKKIWKGKKLTFPFK